MLPRARSLVPAARETYTAGCPIRGPMRLQPTSYQIVSTGTRLRAPAAWRSGTRFDKDVTLYGKEVDVSRNR
jgi:hypothetical protein